MGYQISFWEGEENWASIFVNDKLIGYLWQKHPLFFINRGYYSSFRILLKEHQYIVFIDVDRLTEKELKIDYNDLKDEIEFGINYHRFSAEDLWFYTNSI